MLPDCREMIREEPAHLWSLEIIIKMLHKSKLYSISSLLLLARGQDDLREQADQGQQDWGHQDSQH